ncbi:MAG: hydrolase [Ruminococcaceae bacterium]|nr:hydrolase [Oscillospiraceae bacterium]
MSWIPERDEALAFLRQYVTQDSLLKHALAVEAVMRHFAGFFPDANPDEWGLVGLLHDLDYEQYPEQHCQMTAEILKGKDLEPRLLRAILSHGYGICTDIKPESDMEKVIYTVDELTGLVTASVLMRPSRSILDMELKSLKKKFKTPSFAAGVNRDVVRQGAEALGWELDRVLQETINGMTKAAASLGLDGSMNGKA